MVDVLQVFSFVRHYSKFCTMLFQSCVFSFHQKTFINSANVNFNYHDNYRNRDNFASDNHNMQYT